MKQMLLNFIEFYLRRHNKDIGLHIHTVYL